MNALVQVISSGPSKDIVQLIQEDHDRVRELYRQYKLPGNTSEQKQLLALDIIRQSSIHSRREDMVLYPVLKAANLGSHAVHIVASQHQVLEKKLEQLLSTPIWDPNYDGLLQEYMLMLEDHLREEEDELLPRLANSKGITPGGLMRIGWWFELAKLIAPSRPHSWAPKIPPFTYIFNAVITPLDFARDMIAFRAAPPL